MTVAELLDSPEKWTKDASARKADGGYVSHYSKDACCWCILGAILRVYNKSDSALQKFKGVIGIGLFDSIAEWNDAPERTYDEVIAAVRKAGI